MPSRRGKQKAFSTCSSHLTVVVIFFLTASVMYVSPSEKDILRNQVAAVCYSIITPCLNPFIYSLRNKDMKEALRSVVNRTRGWPMHASIVKVVFREEKATK
ncbi:hypothetical protein NDU88_003416 [Pleurodeles waltl]|uniref:Uncharacterized protein n=2 Tax=Pleurodeles waltl TaxID=8319 RepID=A0AAV7Q9L1_PLEWA|nr:hypothetical protein NDU88_003416 [Pleurodeles waltl]